MAHAIGGAVEADVDVACAGHLQGGDAFDGADLGHQILRDLLRRLSHLPGELKRNRNGELAELGLLRLFDHNLSLHAVTDGDMGLKGLLNTLFE